MNEDYIHECPLSTYLGAAYCFLGKRYRYSMYLVLANFFDDHLIMIIVVLKETSGCSPGEYYDFETKCTPVPSGSL